jgi:hypothetical protein
MENAKKIIIGLASIVTVFALQFENTSCKVGDECLSIAYKSHSALLEQRVRANATLPVTGFSEESYLKHYSNIKLYSQTVDTEKVTYPTYRQRWSQVK